MGAEFVRGRVCQGPSLLGAEMSRNPGFGSFRTRVISDISRFGCGSFRPGHFRLGRFGLILGWVVSAHFNGSFWPDIAQTPHILQYK